VPSEGGSVPKIKFLGEFTQKWTLIREIKMKIFQQFHENPDNLY